MPRAAPHVARLLCALAVASTQLSVVGCKSAEEQCSSARALAEHAWRAQIAMLETEQVAAIAVQSETLSRLTKDVEPRLSEAAATAASQRYDRNSDAWQRLYQASQSAACSADPECSELRRQSAEAHEQEALLGEKLAHERSALAALQQDPQTMKQSAAAVTPELANSVLQAAKQASDAAAAACQKLASQSHQ